MLCFQIRLWFAKKFGERLEWPSPFTVGYRLGRTVYFERDKK